MTNWENCGDKDVKVKPMWEDDTGMMICDLCLEEFNHGYNS